MYGKKESSVCELRANCLMDLSLKAEQRSSDLAGGNFAATGTWLDYS